MCDGLNWLATRAHVGDMLSIVFAVSGVLSSFVTGTLQQGIRGGATTWLWPNGGARTMSGWP